MRNEWDKLREVAKSYKEKYPKGTRIELLFMGDDPNPILAGTKGTVLFVDDTATVHCQFDNGRSLGLLYGIDAFRVLSE